MVCNLLFYPCQHISSPGQGSLCVLFLMQAVWLMAAIIDVPLKEPFTTCFSGFICNSARYYAPLPVMS